MARDYFNDFIEARTVRVDPMLNSLRREINRKVRQFGPEWRERGVVIMNEWCFTCVSAAMEEAEASMLERRGEPVTPWPHEPAFLPLFGLQVFASPDVRVAFVLAERTQA